MSVTAVSDIIVPELFTKYSQERTATQWALVQSGIVQRTPEFDKLAKDGAKSVQMPFFQDISGASQPTPGDGTTELTVNKIASEQDIAAIHYRSNAWGDNDLAGSLAKADPLGAITQLVGDYWSREYQRLLILALKGVFAAASMAGKILNLASEDAATDGVDLDDQNVIDALDLMGDASKSVTAIAMHSKVRNGLWKKDLIDTVRASEAGGEIEMFMGRRIIVDDSLPKVAGATNGNKYTSYLFGEGAFGYGEGIPKNPVETDREILKRNSLLVNDKILILHPRGVKWAATAAGNTPSDAEISTGTSWVRVFEPKNVRIVAIVTNG